MNLDLSSHPNTTNHFFTVNIETPNKKKQLCHNAYPRFRQKLSTKISKSLLVPLTFHSSSSRINRRQSHRNRTFPKANPHQLLDHTLYRRSLLCVPNSCACLTPRYEVNNIFGGAPQCLHACIICLHTYTSILTTRSFNFPNRTNMPSLHDIWLSECKRTDNRLHNLMLNEYRTKFVCFGLTIIIYMV